MDLFGPRVERLRAEGADLTYILPFDSAIDQKAELAALIAETPWQQEKVKLWGKEFDQPRLTAWYGDKGKSYSYSGARLSPLNWTERLNILKEKVERISRKRFNSVLINYYRDGSDNLGLHSDDEPELGKNPVIASLSFGAERTMVFKPKNMRMENLQAFEIKLESGSLLIMAGPTQVNWKHGISKLKRPIGPRVNLTFREIL